MAVSPDINPDSIRQLESAAELFMGDPSRFTADQRRQAEALFTNFRNAGLNLHQCLSIFAQTENLFVVFQVTQCLGIAAFRDWNKLDDNTIQGTYEYLMRYLVNHQNLPQFVLGEMLRCSSRIYKRGVLEGYQRRNSSTAIYEIIKSLVINEFERFRILGCRIIEALAVEFSSSWGGSEYGLTWDFHIRSKKAFEVDTLKNLFELALQVLGNICNYDEYMEQTDKGHAELSEKFLRIANVILYWNFTPKIINLHLVYQNESNASTETTFRPPREWGEVVRNPEFLDLFFKLHTIVRPNNNMLKMSLQCIVQLASTMGEVMEGDSTIGGVYVNFRDQYLQTYIQRFMETFTMPSEEEIIFMSAAIMKLHTYHPVQVYLRIPPELLRRWLEMIAGTIHNYMHKAISSSLADSTHDGSEALRNLFQSWAVIVQHKELYRNKVDQLDAARYNPDAVNFLDVMTRDIVTALFRTFHQTSQCHEEEVSDDHDDEDDIEQFHDLLKHVGTFNASCITYIMPLIAEALLETLKEIPVVFGTIDWKLLQKWQDSTHWTLLIIGSALCSDHANNYLNTRVTNQCLEAADDKLGREPPFDGEGFIALCLTNPEAAATAVMVKQEIKSEESSMEPVANPTPEPLVSILGHLLAMCALQHRMLRNTNAQLCSPVTLRTLLWTTRRVLTGLAAVEGERVTVRFKNNPMWDTVLGMVRMQKDSRLSKMLVEFFLDFCFDIVQLMSGEKKLCEEAIQTLLSVSERRAEEMAGSDMLYARLLRIHIRELSCRRLLVYALVRIGSVCQNTIHYNNMIKFILDPLVNEFCSLVIKNAGTSDTHSQMVDLLECFCGIAEAALPSSAHILLNHILPALELCPRVLGTAHHAQSVVNGVLMLFGEVTEHLIMYITSLASTRKVYDIVASLMKVYRDVYLEKYRTGAVDEEDQSLDLVYFLDVATNILSKDIFNSEDNHGISDGVRISVLELNMLLPLINKSLMSIPSVGKRFFRFILYMTELYPETLAHVDEVQCNNLFDILHAVLSCEFGIEVMNNSLQTIGNIAAYFLRDKAPRVDYVLNRLLGCVPDVFAITLENASQQEIMKNGESTLFHIACNSQEGFAAFIMRTLEIQDPKYRDSLRMAFDRLMDGFTGSPARMALLTFRKKFESFISDVKGRLILLKL
ncbi:hypothetical protein L596_005727 [Steinernema carpocapsae]|uniref:Exportin-4 n=1 Tax=Steinernema carpocapsae TaxID=34508 RepID=A0A4U8V4B0_STECR|nr:hypothetical protein L596_005727 [Steinernema carpocapsae]